MAEGERISVPLDVLRNELTQLELRIVDRIAGSLELKADKAIVAEHDKRITALELSRASREHMGQELSEIAQRTIALENAAAKRNDVEDLERDVDELRMWHNRTIGIVMLIAFIMPVLATVSWHLWG